jgi:hypothetical protein
MSIGLWNQVTPIPPWQWRRGKGGLQTAGVVANRRSRIYHKAACRGAAMMNEKNRVVRQRGGRGEGRVSKGGDCK